MTTQVVRPVVLSLAIVALTAVPSLPAQAEDPRASPDPQSESAATMDVGDLWRSIRHKGDADSDPPAPAPDPKPRFLVVTPTIGSKPSTGLTGGFSGSMAFFSGDPQDTHISSVSGNFRVSQKGQKIAGLKFAIFTDNDRWFLQGDHRFWWTSQTTHGLGSDAPASATQDMKYDFFRFYETAYRRVAPGFLVGLGVNVNDHKAIRPDAGAASTWDQSAYVSYSEKHGFNTGKQISSGTSVGLLFDTRDNAINADRGWLSNAVYRTFFKGFLGGSSTWQELDLDLRTYRKLTPDARHKVAFWFLGNFVAGGTAPYLDLPETGGDGRSARGYSEGRYRGQHLLYGEVEYRGALTSSGLLGAVVFLNATTVDNTDTGNRLFHAVAPAAGFGLRLLLNKRSRTNLCTDYGWGRQGSRGFYLYIQEAF